jgi:hypothetical protein
VSKERSIAQIIRNDEELYEGNLGHYFRVVFSVARNVHLPYHNFRHMLHTLWLCYDASLYYRDIMGPRGVRDLLIAALFHDFDHSGRLGNDDLNIEAAIRGLRTHILPEDKGHLPNIERLIRATEYPYTVPTNELTLLGQILRDADLCQTLSPVWLQQVVFGLAAEWGKTPLEVLKAQEPFLKSISFHTEWAQERFPIEVIFAKIDEARELLALLEER